MRLRDFQLSRVVLPFGYFALTAGGLMIVAMVTLLGTVTTVNPQIISQQKCEAHVTLTDMSDIVTDVSKITCHDGSVFPFKGNIDKDDYSTIKILALKKIPIVYTLKMTRYFRGKNNVDMKFVIEGAK